MKTCVWVVIPSYYRLELLQRALNSLGDQGPALAGVMVVDNSGGQATLPVKLHAQPEIRVVTPSENLGTAGGLALGMRTVLGTTAATHCWIMDDDAEAGSGVLRAMLEALDSAGAEVATSLLIDHRGKVAWYPGPLPQPAWNVIRSGVTPQEFRQRCGATPLPWTWATWASMLVTRKAIEAVGLPDVDLWYQGSDIEYTLRLSSHFPCVLAPAAVCAHLPPPGDQSKQRIKSYWALQNGAYIATRLPHGRRSLRHLPGNHFRHWKAQHYQLRALTESFRAFWRGAICGRRVGRAEYAAV